MLTTSEIKERKEKFNQRGLNLETERAKTRQAYKETDSREQFKRLLVNCKLFSRIDSQESLATRNLAISILQDMGFLDETNLGLIIDFLFTLPLSGEQKDE